jgi:hypothetical protein
LKSLGGANHDFAESFVFNGLISFSFRAVLQMRSTDRKRPQVQRSTPVRHARGKQASNKGFAEIMDSRLRGHDTRRLAAISSDCALLWGRNGLEMSLSALMAISHHNRQF